MEANRAAGDEMPRKKLDGPYPESEGYELRTGMDIRRASFIPQEWGSWQYSTPEGKDFLKNYLSDGVNYSRCRINLVKAITTRVVALYAEWYDTLMVGELFDNP